MAVYIDLAIACGTSEEAKALKTCLESSLLFNPNPSPYEDENHIWWVSLVPNGIGRCVPGDVPYDTSRFSSESEVMSTIHEHLRKCSGYKLALLSWEVADSVFDKTEDEHVWFEGVKIPAYFLKTEGLIVSAKIYQLIENKDRFESFSPGYYWIARTDSWKEFDRVTPPQ